MLVFFFIFAGVDYFTTMAQHQIAQHIMHYYLSRVRLEGWLTTADKIDLIAKYASAQMTVVGVTCTNGGNSVVEGDAGAAPVERNTDPDASEINLLITIKPNQRPFTMGLLIGASAAPSTYRMKVGGSVLSEHVGT